LKQMMMMRHMAVVAAIVIVAMAGSLALAQKGSFPRGGRCAGGELVSLEGTFTDVRRPTASFEAAGRTYDVALGPVWYWRDKGYDLARGDGATITGRLAFEGGGAVLYPSKIVRNGEEYTFTDEEGVPLWADGDDRGHRRGRASFGNCHGACAGPGRGPGSCPNCPCAEGPSGR
jgi:hypothetical protein